MAVAALAVAAPVATVAANGNVYNPVNTKATLTAAELGRAYSVAQAKANLAKADAEKAAAKVVVAESVRIQAEQDLAFAKQEKANLVTQYETELALAVEKDRAAGPNTSVAADAVRTKYAADLAAADESIKAFEDTVAGVTADENTAKAELAKANEALAAAVAELEAAYQAYLNAGGKAEELPKEAPTQSAPAAKPVAKDVKAAATGTASKTLPKTSAAK